MMIPQHLLLSLLPSSVLRLLPHHPPSSPGSSGVELTLQDESHRPPVEHPTDSAASAPVELEPLVSLPLIIEGFYNNRGVTKNGAHKGEGFDGAGATYPSDHIPTGLWVDEGVEFILPEDWDSITDDNVVALNQIIPLVKPIAVNSLHLLVAGDGYDGETAEKIGLTFADGSTGSVELDVANWWAIHWVYKSPIKAPFHFTSPSTKNFNATHIHHVSLPIPPHLSSLPLSSLHFPGRAGWNALHIFAATLIPSVPLDKHHSHPHTPYPIRVRLVRGTHKWIDLDEGGDHPVRAQIVEIALTNPFAVGEHANKEAWVAGRGLEVELVGRAVRTVKAGKIWRLMPGDEVVVQIGVEPGDVDVSGDDPVEVVLREMGEGDVEIGSGKVVGVQQVEVKGSGLVTKRGFGEWTDDVSVLEEHEAPDWFNGAKFGIFIHYGLFSVPAWTDPGRYSEWYWYWQHQDGPDGGTLIHHRETYGEDFLYDDFIPMFNGSKFDADAWIDLFTNAGAKYFVLTTKHHDGYALFDAKHTSNRNSVALGPGGGKDYVKELMDAADRSPVEIKKGTYYSMPEWFSPDYKRYGWAGWPGGLAEDVYHRGRFEPYSGRTKINDYVEDLQLEQMKILTRDYKVDILWCVGGANHTSKLAAEWWTNATKQGRAVTMNNRCGIAPDFLTPEYAQFKTIQSNKWESCEGMDPFSFGYNQRTPDDQYRSVEEIIHKLIDITAKNGNYLLNVGPTGEGEIIHAMSSRLLKVGKWLKTNGRAIYDTTPFALLPELVLPDKHLDLRFTRTPRALYVLSLTKPKSVMVIPARLPILKGDVVSLLGKHGPIELDWEWVEKEGELRILIGETGKARVALDKEKIAWVFEIAYGQGV